MFFLVTHTWDVGDEEEVSREMIKLFYDCHYGKVGNPWPKLFFAWLDPIEPQITALWESSNLKMLKAVFEDRSSVFDATMRHVRQLYPPHVDCYRSVNITTDPDLVIR